MFQSARLLGLFGLLTGLSLIAAVMSFEASAQSVPMEVTSDTPEYCFRLLDRVADLVRSSSSPPPEATRLSAEGDRTCKEGKTRGGIQRLRRAWLLLTHPDGEQARY